MPRGLAGQRAQTSDVNKVAGAAGVGENPPVITKEAGQKTEAKARSGESKKQSGSGHDGVMGERGGYRN